MRVKNVQITSENIVQASWDLLDSIGIEEFSMRKLADRLKIQAPSLYWHFPSKQDLFQSLANEVSKEVLQTVKLEGNWKSQLTGFAVTIKRVMTKYPCSAQLLMRALPSDTNYLALNNALLQIVDPLPLSDSDKFSAIVCLLNYIISFELDRYEQRKVNMELKADASNLFQTSLTRLPENDIFVIKRMHENGIFKELGSDKMFETGLNIIVLGIEQLAAQSGS